MARQRRGMERACVLIMQKHTTTTVVTAATTTTSMSAANCSLSRWALNRTRGCFGANREQQQRRVYVPAKKSFRQRVAESCACMCKNTKCFICHNFENNIPKCSRCTPTYVRCGAAFACPNGAGCECTTVPATGTAHVRTRHTVPRVRCVCVCVHGSHDSECVNVDLGVT